MIEAALAIFTGIVIAAVSSWITVQLSLRKFRSERWWERRVEAYSKAIEALHNSKAFAHHHLEAEDKGRKLSEERKTELKHNAKAAHDEILKAISVGSFLLSEGALSRLEKYQREVEQASKQQTWYDYIDEVWYANDQCLKDFIEIARRDLKAK
jgi:hypothetical protein